MNAQVLSSEAAAPPVGAPATPKRRRPPVAATAEPAAPPVEAPALDPNRERLLGILDEITRSRRERLAARAS